jgi:hypothetical protein
MLVTFAPGRIEGLFRVIAEGGNIDLATIMEQFGVQIVGPTLLEGLYTISSPRSYATRADKRCQKRQTHFDNGVRN